MLFLIDLPITKYLAPISIAFSGVVTFFWSSLLSSSKRIPGVTIRSKSCFVLSIYEAGHIIPSIPDSFATIKSF